MAKFTKRTAIKRQEEARKKIFTCIVTGHITIDQGNKAIKPLSAMIVRLKR